MKNFLLALLPLLAYTLNVKAQSLQITSADTLVQGHVSQSTQVGAKIYIKNVSNAAKDYLVKRIDKNYNSLTDSNAFCWGPICYQTTISVAPMVQTIQPDEEFKGFIGYVYPDAGGTPTKGSIRYVFYDANNPSDSISHVVTYETTATFNLTEKAIPEVKLFPNPTSGLTNLSIESAGNGNLELEIINLVGQTFYRVDIPDNQSRFTFNADQLAPGVYLYSINREGKSLLTRKLVVQ